MDSQQKDDELKGGSEHTTNSSSVLSVLKSRATHSDAERRKLEAFASTRALTATAVSTHEATRAAGAEAAPKIAGRGITSSGGGGGGGGGNASEDWLHQKKQPPAPTIAAVGRGITSEGGGGNQGDEWLHQKKQAPTSTTTTPTYPNGGRAGGGARLFGGGGGLFSRMIENLSNEIDVDEWEDKGGYEQWKQHQQQDDEKAKERERRARAAMFTPAAKPSSTSTLEMVFGKTGISSTSITTTNTTREMRKIADYEQGSRSFRNSATATAAKATPLEEQAPISPPSGAGAGQHWMGRLIHNNNTNPTTPEQQQYQQQILQQVAPLPPGETSTFQQQPGAYSGVPGMGLQRADPLRYSILNNNNNPGATMMMMMDPSSLAFSSASSKSISTTSRPLFEDEPTSGSASGSRRVRRTSTRSRLAVANPIYEDEEQQLAADLPQAQGIEQMMDASERRQYQNKIKCLQYGIGFVSVLAVIFLVVAILVMLNPDMRGSSGGEKELSSSSSFTSDQPTTFPSQSPTLSVGGYVKSLLPDDTVITIENQDEDDPTSPQLLAYNWIMEDPNLSSYSSDRIQQRYALATFYHALGGPTWRQNSGWLSYDQPECNWYAADTHQMFVAAGIMRNLQQAYQDIVLPLVSETSACQDPNNPEVFTHLLLVLNNLRGSIPPELFMLTSLRGILLALNPELTGPRIPTEIVELSSTLETYFFVGTQFTGTIPTQVGLLSNLRTLNFSNNRLSGSLPSELGMLSKLELLDFSRNRMTGTMPTELGSLSQQLTLFNNHHNDDMVGTVPTELGKLVGVSFMSFSRCNHVGRIPSQLGMLTRMKELYFYSNNLIGTVPLELTNLVDSSPGDDDQSSSTLKVLHLHNNMLSGSIPEELCSIETISEATPQLRNQSLVGCDCNCTFPYDQWELCSPLQDKCLLQ